MAAYQVSCITKPDRNNTHESITHLGGLLANNSRWKETKENVIQFIDSNSHTFFTRVNGKEAKIGVVREAGKRPYLRTYADGYYNDNLLALNECPI